MDRYKYYIIDEFSVQTEVFPINKDTYSFDFERKSNSNLYFEKKLSGNLIFSNNSKTGVYDFNYFKDKETNNKCFELEIQIHKLCSGTYSLFWEGLFSVIEGSFDNDKCTYEISPRLKYNIQSDLDVNILDAYSADGSYTVRTGALASERIYYNGRALYYVLLHIAQESNSKITDVVSDFFSINIVGDIDYVNDYYMPISFYSQLKLFPLSEIQEPVPSNRAVKEFISLDKLMQDLNVLFDVYWFIDSNYKLRIEHKVFFEKDLGLDLTQSKFEKYLVGTNKISYDLDDIPKYETFKIIGSKQYCRITYFGCGEINKNKNEKIYSTNVISTDYYSIRYGSGSSGDANGIFMMACYQSLGLFRMRENGLGQNYLMQSALLVQYFKRYGRPSNNNNLEYYEEEESLQTIAINQGKYLAYSLIPTKIQSEFSVPICCEDEFDSSKKITTNLGVGYLDSAKFNMRTNSLSLKLKYKAEDDNVEILPNQISGCTLWLTADTGVIYDGSNRVSEWQDQSGNFNHARQSNNTYKPIYSPTTTSLSFFVNLFLTTPSIQLFPSKRGTIFYLAYPTDTGGAPMGAGNMAILSTDIGNKFDVSINVQYSAGPPASNTFTLKSFNLAQNFPRNTVSGLVQINRESDTEQTMFSNGLKPSVLAGNPLTIANLQIDAAPLIIGRNPSIGTLGPVNVKEVIVFDRAISDSERQQIELYLIKKWGIELYQEY